MPDGFDVYGGGELLNGLLAQSNLSRSASDQFRVRARAYEIAPTGSYAAQKIHEDRRGFCRDTEVATKSFGLPQCQALLTAFFAGAGMGRPRT